MVLCYFCRCCCPHLHTFNRRQGRILLARKSQSCHHLAFEIHSLLHHMPFMFLHLHRIPKILGSIFGQMFTKSHYTEIPQISLTLGFPVTLDLTRNNC
ncbi:UNVERIFIED_CONTAM: hypothetical protein NCL1_22989 [Trichonephila clavipes]